MTVYARGKTACLFNRNVEAIPESPPQSNGRNSEHIEAAHKTHTGQRPTRNPRRAPVPTLKHTAKPDFYTPSLRWVVLPKTELNKLNAII
jgi:hypothetical protein